MHPTSVFIYSVANYLIYADVWLYVGPRVHFGYLFKCLTYMSLLYFKAHISMYIVYKIFPFVASACTHYIAPYDELNTRSLHSTLFHLCKINKLRDADLNCVVDVWMISPSLRPCTQANRNE